MNVNENVQMKRRQLDNFVVLYELAMVTSWRSARSWMPLVVSTSQLIAVNVAQQKIRIYLH